MTKPTVGLFGIGLDTYWAQFDGLEARLRGYIDEVAALIGASNATVINMGMVDTVDKARLAGERFKQEDVEIIFVYSSTYALSATVLPAVHRVGVPVVLLNLQPAAAMDYAALNAMGDRTRMTGEWLAWCGACPVPEIANVLKRVGIPFYQVTGVLTSDPHVVTEIGDWVEAACVAKVMRNNRMGLLGRYYNGMLDIYTDQLLQLATFGGHIEVLEIDELAELHRAVEPGDVEKRLEHFSDCFAVQPDCSDAELSRAARTSIALDVLVEKHSLGSLAYYYESIPGHEYEDIVSSVILGNSLLTARGVPVAGEYEIKNVQAMKILDTFNAGGSFSEYYAIDYADDVVLFGHDGPGHIAIAEGQTKVKPLSVYHGKPGQGLSVEMSVRHGSVTLLSVMEREGKLAFLCAEGESVAGPILQIGNTNSRYRFNSGARQFVEAWNAEGPAHHCAIGVGHLAKKLDKLAKLLNIECINVK